MPCAWRKALCFKIVGERERWTLRTANVLNLNLDALTHSVATEYSLQWLISETGSGMDRDDVLHDLTHRCELCKAECHLAWQKMHFLFISFRKPSVLGCMLLSASDSAMSRSLALTSMLLHLVLGSPAHCAAACT
jgi:hypothetical protein